MTITSDQPAAVSPNKLERHFTEDGVDPYQTVEWERRDAKLTNFLDGSVSFEH